MLCGFSSITCITLKTGTQKAVKHQKPEHQKSHHHKLNHSFVNEEKRREIQIRIGGEKNPDIFYYAVAIQQMRTHALHMYTKYAEEHHPSIIEVDFTSFGENKKRTLVA